jgi:GNAT superfamily N-acetyltransferase
MREIRLLRTASEKSLLDKEELEACIPLFKRELLSCRAYLVAYEGAQVVGLAGLAESSRRVPQALGVAFISTHQSFRRQGVARDLVEALFKLAKSSKQDLATTPYGADGRRWLRPMMRDTARRYPQVTLHEC